MAAIAASTPLFPNLPPLLSIDCLIFSSVRTQNIIGHFPSKFRSLIPLDVALHIKSKCFVSPLITLPIAIIAS